MIFHFRIVFLLIYLLCSNLIFAQEKEIKYTYSTGAEVFTGFILKHHDVIGNLITGHPSGARLSFNRQSYGNKAWEQRYNYPTLVSTLSYYDLKNEDILGKIVALNIGLGFHLNRFTTSKNDVQLLFGYGLAYFTKPYDHDSNNTNTLISNHLPWSVNLKLSYFRQITNKFKVGAALQVSHFSNGSSSVPNYGINIVNLNFGATYNLYSDHPAYQDDKKSLTLYDLKSYINIDFRMGITELKPVGSGPSPYYAMSVFWNKRVNKRSILDAGVEGFMNKGIQQAIINNASLIEGTPDYKGIGIMFGHELILEKLALVTQLGVYVYKEYIPDERIYAKVGLKYYFNKNIFGSFILKTHYAVAEVMEFGIGYRL